MSSQGKASHTATSRAPKKSDLPAADVQDFRAQLKVVLGEKDTQGRVWSSSQWGVYAFYDYDGEPIYVGQVHDEVPDVAHFRAPRPAGKFYLGRVVGGVIAVRAFIHGRDQLRPILADWVAAPLGERKHDLHSYSLICHR